MHLIVPIFDPTTTTASTTAAITAATTTTIAAAATTTTSVSEPTSTMIDMVNDETGNNTVY